MKTTNSPLHITKQALLVAEHTLPPYSHKFSPKKYTQHQLFALLILKQFFKEDYRGVVGIIADFREVRHILQIRTVPHITTLQKAAKRIMRFKIFRGLKQSSPDPFYPDPVLICIIMEKKPTKKQHFVPQFYLQQWCNDTA